MDDAIRGDPRLGIGANGPPPPTPYEAAASRINGLYDEAMLWLDGAVIDSPELADGVAHLKNALTEARKNADQARAAEKQPHLEAGRAVDDAYKPLLSKADKAIGACKEAIQPWLDAIEAEYRRMAEGARAEALAAAAEAQDAIRSADRSNLAAVEAAEALLTRAKKIDNEARKAERVTAKAGSLGRAVSLRTSYTPVMTDPMEALKHYRLTEPEAVKEFLQSLAVRDVRAGKRHIPGFTVEERQTAV